MTNFFSQFHTDDDLANKVEWQESRGNQNAVSPKGAFGVMQLMPETARDPGFGIAPLDPNAPDPEEENRRVGRDYLKVMLNRYGGDKEAALAAYNWGPGNADKWVAGGKNKSKLPRETRGYIENILGGELHGVDIDPNAPALGAVGKPNFFSKFHAEPTQEPAPEAPAAEKVPQQAAPGMAQYGISPHSGTEDVDVGADLQRSFISGTGELLTGLAGLPGTIERFGESFLPEDQRGADLPDAEVISKWLSEHGVDFSYEPKTAGGTAIKSVLPYTVAAGKLGAAKGLLPNARNVGNVAQVYAGGKVGQAVGGDAGEIIGAAVMGGRTGMPKTPKGHKDTVAAFAEGSKQYKVPEKLGVDVNGRRFYAFAHTLKKDKNVKALLSEPNLEGSLKQAVTKMLDAVEGPQAAKYVGAGQKVTPKWNPRNMSIDEYDRFRRSITKFLGKEDANVRRQAGIVVKAMDKHFGKPSNLTGTAANKQKAVASLPKAREAWRRGMQSKKIDRAMALAENRAVGLTGSGRENAIRHEFKKIIDKIDRSDVEKNKWSKDEIKAIRKIARIGWGPRRALRTVGRFNPMGIGGFGYAGYGGLTGDWESAGIAGGLTLGSRALAGSLAARRAKALQDLALAGGKKVGDPNQVLRGAMGGYLGSQ
jgi:hypothetical protein